ncbi:hypothetical protein [Cupriavidus sp. CuC1]|uniref:hypothetical protein n=1 Tax=Cupriavidus sp. CuC1 TaxID=3373131 RepID=UPI0037D62037
MATDQELRFNHLFHAGRTFVFRCDAKRRVAPASVRHKRHLPRTARLPTLHALQAYPKRLSPSEWNGGMLLF